MLDKVKNTSANDLLELNKRVEDSKRLLDANYNESQRLTRECASIKVEIDRKEAYLKDLNTRIEKQEKREEDAKKRVSDIGEEISVKNDDKNRLHDDVSELSVRLTAMQAQAAKIEKADEKRKKDLLDLESKIADKQKELLETEKTVDNKLQKIKDFASLL